MFFTSARLGLLHLGMISHLCMPMQLGLFEEALQDAEKGRALATARLKVTRKSIPGYVKTFLRKGVALNGRQTLLVYIGSAGASSV